MARQLPAPVMHLIQLLLPLYDLDGTAFARAAFDDVAVELTARFGGVTSYARAPARGRWEDDDGKTAHDDIVVVEVMVDELDRGWWAGYRDELARRFSQQELVVRALDMQRL
jgi:hypothetical protein